MNFANIVFLAGLFVMQGALAEPTYEPLPNEGLAKVKMSGMIDFGQPVLCKGGKKYAPPNLVGAADKKITGMSFDVPVGETIDIAFRLHFYTGTGNAWCTSQLSFYPRAGQTYLANTSLKGRGCFIELVREDRSKETGVSIEPSVAVARCEQ